MTLTKREAIERTKQLWEVLAEKNAMDSPVRAKYAAFDALWPDFLDEDVVSSACWACEYAAQQCSEEKKCGRILPVCDYCPVWTGDKNCTDVDQAYSNWRNQFATNEQRKEAAREIVALCDKALAELDRRGK